MECFILSNNFVGPSELPSKIYLSRMLWPIQRVLEAARIFQLSSNPMKLKYLIFNLHDTNVSNLLRFLGYFDTYGYKKWVKFSSSVRFELLSKKGETGNFRIRTVFDNEEIHLPFCTSLYCEFGEFSNHFYLGLEFNKA
jgi:hypothetical protein